MTPQEFAQKIRTKYPGSYDNLSDDELTKRVIEKYPVYASKINTSTPAANFKQLSEDRAKLGKLADFVGGKKLAEGAGLAVVAPSVQKNLSDAELSLSDTELNLIKQINLNKKSGKDVSRLEAALKNIQDEKNSLRTSQESFTESLPSTGEVVGSAVRLAGTAALPNVASGISKVAKVGEAAGVLSGATRGLGAGAATGAIEGAVQGTGIGLEQGKTTEDAVKTGLIGAGLGAITGGIIGTIGGAVSGGLTGRKIKFEEFSKELATPKQTAKVRAEAIQQGRIQDPTLFEKARIQYSKRDEQLANSIKDVVSPKNTLGENIDAIRYKINQTNAGVKTYITTKKVPFNTNQVKSVLNSGKEDLRLVFASDQNAEKTYDAVVDAFMKNLETKDTLGLFNARQDFDKLPAVRKLLESDRLGENARKEIVLTVRRMANDYIASQLPAGNQYRNLLLQESQMIEALGNISKKASNLIGKNKLQMLSEEYPWLKWVVGGIATGLAGGAGVGVGSAIIGSTD